MKFESILLPGIDPQRPLVISGPCSAETEEQVMNTAKALAAKGVKIFRAGVWKPRTKPGGFEGVGAPALKWLQRVKEETGMYVAVEVATQMHAYEALKYGVDMLWIGARTAANPFSVQEIADTLDGVDIPVLIKNPVNPDLELWVGAIERLYNAGIKKLGVIHRGFSTNEKIVYRNLPNWHIAIELKRRFPDLPMICDPSHIAGNRELIEMISQRAMDFNYDGLIIESHCSPDDAWSDKDQQITPDALEEVLNNLIIRDSNQGTEDLSELRGQIDQLDIKLLQLLAQRMRVSRDIGQYKVEHKMPILQTGRYSDILNDRIAQAESLGMAEKFAKRILEAIHTESVRQQVEVMEAIKEANRKNK